MMAYMYINNVIYNGFGMRINCAIYCVELLKGVGGVLLWGAYCVRPVLLSSLRLVAQPYRAPP